MRLVCVLLALSLCLGCKRDTPRRSPDAAALTDAERDAAFWSWVRTHVEELRAMKSGQEPIAAELAQELSLVDKRLAFELAVGKESLEVVISADGNPQVFPIVERVVAAAPKGEGLKAVAFRQRKGDGLALQLGHVRVGFDTVFFTSAPDAQHPGQLAVKLYIRGLDMANREPFQNAAFVLLDAALGEHDVDAMLGTVEIAALPDSVEGLSPLKELAATVDAAKVKK